MFVPFFDPYVIFTIIVTFILMLMFPSTLVYRLSLVLYVSILVISIVSYSFVNGLMGLLLLIVYVGAIIVIIRYICAVSPNIKYTYSLSSSLSLLIFIVFAVLAFMVPSPVYSFSSSFAGPSFMFTDIGI